MSYTHQQVSMELDKARQTAIEQRDPMVLIEAVVAIAELSTQKRRINVEEPINTRILHKLLATKRANRLNDTNGQ